MTGLLIACWAALAAAAAIDLLPRHPGPRLAAGCARASLLLSAAASLALLVLGALAMTGRQAATGSLLAAGDGGAGTDRLTGLFLVITFGAAMPALVTAAAPPHPAPSGARQGLGTSGLRRGLGAVLALLLASLSLTITAQGAFTFLFGWEGIGFAFYLIAGFDRRRPGRARASVLTAGFSKLSGAFLLLGLLLLAARANSLAFAHFTALPPGPTRSSAYVLLIIGFAVKVGMAPVQIWLPAGYSAAPGPARAVMAGGAVNVGFYGLWRTLQLLGAPPRWLAVVLLLIAASSALLGIAHVAVQDRLSRVIAFSSVENAGLITTGYAVALVGASVHQPLLTAVGLLAATLQVVTHAMAKTLLFTTGHRIGHGFGSDRLDDLRGTVRTLPVSSTGFAIGCLTLAGLPLTCGLVSEWMLLEALLQQFRVPFLAARLAMAAAGALVALTAGFAGVAFVRLVGLTVLGSPPTTALPGARDPGLPVRALMATMATGCLALAAIAPLEVRALAAGLAPIVPRADTLSALKGPWVLQPVYNAFSILSPSWQWIAMPLLALAVTAALLLLSRGRALRVRRVPAWRSATGGVQGPAWYTSHGYANPTRRILAGVLHTRSTLTPIAPTDTGGQTNATAPEYDYTSDTAEVVETYLYQPLLRPLRATVRAAKKLQNGRLDAYLTYLLLALIAVVALVTAMA